jgi:Putative zinc-finger
MNCAEFEVLLADYLDNTLSAPERATLQQHASSCASCRELLNDASGALGFLQRAEEVAMPPELVTRIAYLAPAGRIRDPFERQGFFSRLLGRWLQPVLQPRLVMGMAMTILSFAMLERCTGIRVQQIQAADLNPVRIWGGVEDRAIRLKDRAVKYYENLRWVYEIEVRLRSLQDQSEAMPEQTDRRSGGEKTQDTSQPGSGTTRSQGEMNGDKR